MYFKNAIFLTCVKGLAVDVLHSWNCKYREADTKNKWRHFRLTNHSLGRKQQFTSKHYDQRIAVSQYAFLSVLVFLWTCETSSVAAQVLFQIEENWH